MEGVNSVLFSSIDEHGRGSREDVRKMQTCTCVCNGKAALIRDGGKMYVHEDCMKMCFKA